MFLFAAASPQAAKTQQQPAGAATNTRSPHGTLNIPCQNCHTFTGWKPIRNIPEFNHSQTNFPLRGMHKSVSCSQCHVNPVFSKVGHKCADCHADIHRRQMGAQCEQCHNVQGWASSVKSVREHQNRFPLIGAHALVECDSCHKNAAAGQYAGLSTDCASCHLGQYSSAKTPDHVALGFPTTCQQCHTTMDNWLNAKFDHSVTGFALTGAHASLDCTQCHVGGKFQSMSANCISCHQADFSTAKNPDHVKSGFPTTCQQCHSTVSWAGAKFDHSTTGFSLTGAHASLECTQCHVGGKYQGTSANCVSCHQTDFNNAKDPDHLKSGFPTTCQQCHSTVSWAGAKFDHNTFTSFPLTGAHVTVTCTQCHINGRFAGTPKDCASCHITDFQKTTNPNHVAAAFPTDCSICHSTATWAGAVFDHSKTLFPLTGAHVSQTCASCHKNGVFAGLSTACSSCHLANFNATTNPNHVTAGFPQTCELCHTTAAWIPANFDHSKTAFPLTGAHVTVQCASCHVGGRYAGTPTDCYSCHKSDYTGVSNPNHVAAAFPTTCLTCHNTTSWTGATFNHTWFPIYSGTHAGKWTTCADCHQNATNYATFTCTSCHAHDKTTTDQNHRQVRNYVYNSANCYSCHPTGRAG